MGSMITPITEVTARHGHRRWVYGPLDPARPIEIKALDVLTEESALKSILAHLAMIDRMMGFGPPQ